MGSDTATLIVETEGDIVYHGTWNRSNYLAFFGDQNLGATFSNNSEKAAFGINYGTRLTEITNGTSQTMIFGEYLKGLSQEEAPNDLRGVHWIDLPGMSQLYTQLAPNSTSPDLFNPSSTFCPDESYDQPKLNLPCGGGGLDDLTAASRSRHPGGVNVLKADGSVHFVSQTINLSTWQAMGAISSGDIVSEY